MKPKLDKQGSEEMRGLRDRETGSKINGKDTSGVENLL